MFWKFAVTTSVFSQKWKSPAAIIYRNKESFSCVIKSVFEESNQSSVIFHESKNRQYHLSKNSLSEG